MNGGGFVHCNVTAHPTAQWTGQQLREAFPFDQSPRYLLRDRDAIFGDEFRDQVRDLVFAAGETIIGLPHRLLRSPRLLHPILFTKIEFSIGTDELVTKFLVEFVARFCNIETI